METVHVERAAALQRACFPAPFPEDQCWTAEHLLAHVARAPECQFVALHEGAVVGSASGLRVSSETWAAHLPWEQATGGWELEGHVPDGGTLYGADISVHPDWRGQGVGRALYAARFALVRRLQLARFGTACRLPGLRDSGMEAEGYCEGVTAGLRSDRTLTPLLRYGLRYMGVIRGYLDDPESCDTAAVLEWSP